MGIWVECLWHQMCYWSVWLFTWNRVSSVFRFMFNSCHYFSFSSSISCSPLGRGILFSLISPHQDPYLLIGYPKKANVCLCFSHNSTLKLSGKKRKGEFWLTLTTDTKNITSLEGKKMAVSYDVCSVPGKLLYVQMWEIMWSQCN